MENFWLPWVKYPPLTEERLSIVAATIRRAQQNTLTLYDPLGGDSNWSHGCRAYARSIFALTQASETYPWLAVLPELEPLRSTFAIGGIPFRFYRGIAEEPPAHYLAVTFVEVKQLQMAFSTGFEGLLRPLDKIFRIAVEADERGETTDISLIEVDEARNVTNSYVIPLVNVTSGVTSIQAAPIELPAPSVEPLKTKLQETKEQHKKKNG